jgi:hypothetical protein
LARDHLLFELGWGDHDRKTAERRLRRWQHEKPLVALADIEDALTAPTSPLLFELYPEVALELEFEANEASDD